MNLNTSLVNIAYYVMNISLFIVLIMSGIMSMTGYQFPSNMLTHTTFMFASYVGLSVVATYIRDTAKK